VRLRRSALARNQSVVFSAVFSGFSGPSHRSGVPILRRSRRIARWRRNGRRTIDATTTFVLGVGIGRHTEEFSKRCATGAGESLVLRERDEDDVSRVVVNELGTIDQRPSDYVSE
jgi:hypothetical protein